MSSKYRNIHTGEVVEAKLRHEWVFWFANSPDYFYSVYSKDDPIRDIPAKEFQANYKPLEESGQSE